MYKAVCVNACRRHGTIEVAVHSSFLDIQSASTPGRARALHRYAPTVPRKKITLPINIHTIIIHNASVLRMTSPWRH